MTESKGYWDRLLSRRRALAAAGMAGMAAGAAALVGCGGGDDGDGGPTPGGLIGERKDTTKDAKPGGIYQSYQTASPPSLDYIGATVNSVRGAAAFPYSRLFKWKPGIIELPKGEIEGDLVESWELAGDAMSITMKLRPNAKWDARPPTNSRPLDSSDVKFSMDRMKAVSVYRNDWFRDVNPNQPNPSAPIVSVETPDQRTVKLNLSFPLAALFDYLANTLGLFIMPKESDGGFDPRETARGTGAWIVDKFEPATGIEYKRNPNWYVKDRPFLDGWSQPIIQEYATQLAQFRAGNIWSDVVRQEDIITTKKELPQLLMLQGEHGAVAPGVFFGWSNSPFLDERVRRAMSLLIDRQEFAAAFADEARFKAEGIELDIVYDNFLGKGWGDFYLDPYSKDMGEAAAYFKKDVAEAKKLLAAAGHPNGFQTSFYGPTGTPYGVNYMRNVEVLIGMFAEGGIKTDIKIVDYANDYVPNYNYGQGFNGWSVFVNTTYGGVANQLRTNWHSGSAQDRTPYAPLHIPNPPKQGGQKDTTLDGLIDRLLREPDLKKQVGLAHDIQRHLGKTLYTIPFAYKTRGLSLTWPWVGNAGVYRGWVITSPPTDTLPYLWYDASKRTS
ncbi:MAG TPA: ABC transporter substrate-binding protein [Dehalococcoidia bacterium]|nr:ABC transporter substrate-binding protein [Dehalococcoidia bacterium]